MDKRLFCYVYNWQVSPFFIIQVYKKYLDAVILNIQQRFPDNHILKAFNIFNPAEAELQQYHELEVCAIVSILKLHQFADSH